MEQPYQIHPVELNSEADFENFKRDGERKKSPHLKEQGARACCWCGA